MGATLIGRTIVLAIAGLVLTACLGPLKYGPMAENNGLGYRDRQNPDGSYTVLVIANDSATAHQFWDRRAQELCGSANFHQNIFRAEVPVVRRSGYATNAYNPSYGGAYTEDVHGSFYLEGYLRCEGGAAPAPGDLDGQTSSPSAAAQSPATVTP